MTDENSRDGQGRRGQILDAARAVAKSHGYTGLNFRHLAGEVGITSASLHYHFPTKADLGEALARQYRELAAAELAALAEREPDLSARLTAYIAIFRRALEDDNQICLASQLGAEYDDLPEPVRRELAAFADVNIAWLGRVLHDADQPADGIHDHAVAIFTAISGAQLVARGTSDIALFDATTATYRRLGLIP
ncbi:MAG TPA: TetR/AcrR family transcriptional regulator [Croceibacterium sp.]|nr:TetR/AcrR family transcriptional regulator [Croceibacterium sp.]